MPVGTAIAYNGVTIEGCEVLDISQSIVYDPSGTDREYDDVEITVRGSVHLGNIVTHGASPSGATVSARYATLEEALMEPAHLFVMTLTGGETFLQVSPQITGNTNIVGFDLNNGPKPQRVRIVKVVSNRMLKIEYTIRLAIVNCPSSANDRGILSNRWGFTDVIDANWFTRRILRGVLRVANISLNINSFRKILIPKLQKGFKRELMEFVTSTDGLTISYTIIDAQTKQSAPFPATTIKGTHTVTNSIDNGALPIHQIEFTLFAPPDVKKGALFALADKIVTERINYQSATDGSVIILNYSLIDIIDDSMNAVGVSVQAQQTKEASTFDKSLLDITKIGKDFVIPNYDPLIASNPPPFGTTNATALLISYLQSPCDDAHDISLANAGSIQDLTGPTSGGDGTVIINQTSDEIPSKPAPYTSDHQQAPYTNYQIDQHYVSIPMRAHMAIGAVTNSQGQVTSNDTATVVTLGRGPIQQKVVRVRAERQGKPPVFPNVVDSYQDANSITHWLLDTRLVHSGSELSPDGVNYSYSTTVEFTYGMSRPLTATDQVKIPVMPWSSQSLSQNTFQLTALASNNLVG